MTTAIMLGVCIAVFVICMTIEKILRRLRKLEALLSHPEQPQDKPPAPGPDLQSGMVGRVNGLFDRLNALEGMASKESNLFGRLRALEGMVRSKGDLLERMHLVLQQKRMMPWIPMEAPVLKDEYPYSQGSSIPVIRRPVKSYDVVALRNGQITGYLAEDGTWTLDPKRIKTWANEEDAKALFAKVVLPEGVTAKVREHSSER